MNPNTETPVVEVVEPPRSNAGDPNVIAFSVLFGFGVVAVIVLIIVTGERIHRIKREFYQRRRDVERKFYEELHALRISAAPNSPSAQTTETALSVPVTPAEVRDRRKITRLYK